MYFADPGGTNWEEVNRHEVDDPPGLNFGWGVMEGSHCRIDGCDQHGLVPPIAEYLGSGAGRGDCAIIGGLISRPPARDIQNRYVFGDLCSGRIRSLDVESLSGELLLDTDLLISAFGMDETGSIYVGDHPTGRIYRIVDQHAGPEPSGSDP
jgi:hypothetical protein